MPPDPVATGRSALLGCQDWCESVLMRTNQRFGKILLATDGSEQSAAAADSVTALARSSCAQVKVVHVWNLEVHHRHGYWDVEVRTEAGELVDSIVSRMRSAGIDALGEVLRADGSHVAAAIAAEARNFNADLVVVGSRGLSEFQAMLKHSVSHELLAKLDCPLLLVRSRRALVGGAMRIVVAVAGGDDVAPTIEAAIGAASPGSKALVVHVAQAIFGSQGFGYVEPEEEASQTVARTVSVLTEAGLSASGFVAHSEPVSEVIVKVAREWDADIIVTGSSRMGDLASAVLGSVSHDVVHVSDRPVLIAERIPS